MIKYHYIVPVWGTKYIDIFLRFSLPTQLAPGNIGALKQRHDIVYRIYTRPQDKALIENSKAYALLASYLDTRVIELEHVNFNADHHYIPFSACYKEGMKNAAKDGAASLFLTADQIWSNGSMSHIVSLGDSGKKAVLINGPRLLSETFIPVFQTMLQDIKKPYVILPSRQAVRLAMTHLHPWDKSLFWDAAEKGRPASFMYWWVGSEGFIMRCFHIFPALIKPETVYPDFPSTLDASNFVGLACPDVNDAYLVNDSDKVMFFSIAEAAQSAEWIDRPKQGLTGILKWVLGYGLYPHNLCYLNSIFRFHTGEISQKWLLIEKQSDRLVRKINLFLAPQGALLVLRFLRMGALASFSLFRKLKSVIPKAIE